MLLAVISKKLLHFLNSRYDNLVQIISTDLNFTPKHPLLHNLLIINSYENLPPLCKGGTPLVQVGVPTSNTSQLMFLLSQLMFLVN